MPSIITLRKDLNASRELTEIIDVLKKISAAQFYSLERRRLYYESFTAKMKSFFSFINVSDFDHPLLKAKKKRRGIVIITSDEGLLGELNTLVVKHALESKQPGEDVSLFVIGERGANYLKERNETIVSFPGISGDVNLSEPEELRNFILRKILEGHIGEVELFYPKFISFTQQKVKSIRLLPVDFPPSRLKIIAQKGSVAPVIIEPSLKKIVEYLVSIWLTHNLYEVYWDSKLSELAARAIHLEGSYNELLNRNKKLSYQYFRSRREATDKSIREVFASMLTLEEE